MRRTACMVAAAAMVSLAMAAPTHAAFPGANGRIAFESDRQTPLPGIYTVRPDGTGLRYLPAGRFGRQPAWSPDGRRIAFVRNSLEAGNNQLHIMDADGTNLTWVPNTGIMRDPAWAPDGRHLVFSDFDDHRIYSIRTDGTERTELARGRDEMDPAWSPDGTQIAFISNRLTDDVWSGFQLVYKMNADGTNQTRLTTFALFEEHPNWSPDGKRIAFHSSRPPFGGILGIDPDGGNLQVIASGQRAINWWPAWSPDGEKIVFTKNENDEHAYSIWTMNADGSGQVPLTRFGHFDLEPDWQPVPPGNRPPDCAGVTATPVELAPDDRFFRTVALSATDPDGDEVTLTITGVTQDEPVRGGPDKTAPDAEAGEVPDEVRLRAERRNGRDGRVYRVAFTAEDIFEARCTGTATVSVRKKPKDPAVDSAPPSHDSFGTG